VLAARKTFVGGDGASGSRALPPGERFTDRDEVLARFSTPPPLFLSRLNVLALADETSGPFLALSVRLLEIVLGRSQQSIQLQSLLVR
jgi:hypothetical protein